jgi:hypothetical protein
MPNGNCGPVVVSCLDIEAWLRFTGRLDPDCELQQGSGIRSVNDGVDVEFATQSKD